MYRSFSFLRTKFFLYTMGIVGAFGASLIFSGCCDKGCKKDIANKIITKGNFVDVFPARVRYPDRYKIVGGNGENDTYLVKFDPNTGQINYTQLLQTQYQNYPARVLALNTNLLATDRLKNNPNNELIYATTIDVVDDNDPGHLENYSDALGWYAPKTSPSDANYGFFKQHFLDKQNNIFNYVFLLPLEDSNQQPIRWYQILVIDRETPPATSNAFHQPPPRPGAAFLVKFVIKEIAKGSGDELNLGHDQISPTGQLSDDGGDIVALFIADEDFKNTLYNLAQNEVNANLLATNLGFRSPSLGTQTFEMSIGTAREKEQYKNIIEMLYSQTRSLGDVDETRHMLRSIDFCCQQSAPPCFYKALQQLLSKGNLSIALQLLQNAQLSTENVLCLINSSSDAEQVGALLTGLLYEYPWTFVSIEPYDFKDAVQLSQANFNKAISILNGAFAEFLKRNACDEYDQTKLCDLVQLAATVPGLIGATLCKMATGNGSWLDVDIALICRILTCLIDLPSVLDFPNDGYVPLTSFTTEACSLFACMKLDPSVSEDGSVSLLANIILNAFKSYYTDCQPVIQALFSVLCGTDACGVDRSALVAKSLEYAQESIDASESAAFFAWFNDLLIS